MLFRHIVSTLAECRIAADKLVLGIPTFGRAWKVRNDTGEPPLSADGPGDAGPLTKVRGLLAYPEICNNLTTASSSSCTMTVVRSGHRQTSVHAYCPASSRWVSFDDPEMAGYKATYALSMGLGGVQVVDMSLDDFGDLCRDGPYPILREVHCSLQGGTC
ncbi:hypothetical protein PR048_022902 [Dryococelus australis]|uniref:GH18 domain-containing protein n=1 Tax=Dryococelus australis TaxID=614101 RepID=A0ABQ9GSI8_9NEOP|nr:hypothetical protein PR048_022902 [Dryococelus australis]